MKQIDYWPRWEGIGAERDPLRRCHASAFARAADPGDARERLQQKLALTKRLYRRGFSKETIIGLYRFLDWVLTLPELMDEQYQTQLSEYEELSCRVATP